ncbi:hypothetical protein J1N35_026879 [Gossypium stocksii]|uniref:Uncharacterized protein n=2 Tax=Gossypium TaxID=3633 RepID=A0A9D3ZZ18_9ROSI|nr:hypothetical protein J1N35_026879 [Gossypium stocksii]
MKQPRTYAEHNSRQGASSCQHGRMMWQVGRDLVFVGKKRTLAGCWRKSNNPIDTSCLLSLVQHFKENHAMGFSVNTRGFILVSCIALLVFQTQIVSAMRGIDLALKWDKGLSPLVENSRILGAVGSVDSLQTPPSLAPAPSIMFDPNRSNKRSVKKGSDPIHNRC